MIIKKKTMNLMAKTIFKGAIRAWSSMSVEERLALNRATAKRMFDKAMNGEIKEPYTKEEVKFIKEYYLA